MKFSEKNELMRKAWNNPSVAAEITKAPKAVCCGSSLPQNEKNPTCYQNASDKMYQVP